MTPALVLDRAKLKSNAQRLSNRLPECVTLRPHLKTCKSIEVARVALCDRPLVATVSTLREAEYFFANGINDLMCAVGVVPDKLERVAALLRKGARLQVVTDDIGVARQIGLRAERLGVRFPCWIEVDVDGHRAGVRPGSDELLGIAETLQGSPGAELVGVMTHAGESFVAGSLDAVARAAEQERAGVVEAASRLRDAGIPCHGVSAGSSPTALTATSFEGLSEVRAGVYLFWDLFQSNLGMCRVDDIALSVLTTVIGHQPRRNWLLTDAGGHALSKDRATATQSADYAFGQVCDIGGRPLPGMLVAKANQEHGVIESAHGAIDLARFPIGARVRVLPNHACATAACHDRYFVVDGGREVVDEWPRINGW